MSEEEKRLLKSYLTKSVPRDKEYHGCRNCENQIEPMRGCEWLEHGGDGVFHLVCPMWKKRKEECD